MKNFLTIRDPLCYPSQISDTGSRSENQSVFLDLDCENGCYMRTGGKLNFFLTCHSELIRAHSTGKRSDVNRLCGKLQSDVRPYAAKLASTYRHTTIDLDDLIQEGLMALVEFLPGYRYRCPRCSKRFKDYELYLGHCERNYGSAMGPSTEIRFYFSHIIRGRMLNVRRHYMQKKRAIKNTIYLSDLVVSDKEVTYEDILADQNGLEPENLTASKEAIDLIRSYLDKERNKIIREFVGRVLDGATDKEAHAGVSEAGLAVSAESVRVTIYNLKKQNRSFLKYRRALAG